MSNPTPSAAADRIADDLRRVIASAEELLAAGTSQSADRIASARSRLESVLGDARVRLHDAEAALVERAREAAASTEKSIRDNPWKAVGLSAGIGLLVGVIIGRK